MKKSVSRVSMFYDVGASTQRAAHILRRDMTKAEAVLWKKLKDRKLFNTKFRKQHPIYIFIVDFYCHEYKLVIEVDGEIHNDEETRRYDLGRTEVLIQFGLKVIRFTNDEILYSMASVLSKINLELTKRTLLGGQGGQPN